MAGDGTGGTSRLPVGNASECRPSLREFLKPAGSPRNPRSPTPGRPESGLGGGQNLSSLILCTSDSLAFGPAQYRFVFTLLPFVSLSGSDSEVLAAP